MDPLSITVSVATLLGLTTRLSSSLRDLRSDLRSAAGELDSIEQELNGLGSVLARVQLYAEGARELTCQDGANEELGVILCACERTVLEIETKAGSAAQRLRGNRLGQLKQSLSWPSLKRELGDLRNQLERHKSSILLSLHLESLYVSWCLSEGKS
jgi:Fungal N-terminal domain of STAND proteins